MDSGDPLPSGSASLFDEQAVEQACLLMRSRMRRLGCLDGEASIQTTQQKRGLDLHVRLKLGQRWRCGKVVIADEGSGLPDMELEQLLADWRGWEGQWLDLDGFDQQRNATAIRLQNEGYFGFLPEHIALDIDTSSSGKTGLCDISVRILPRRNADQVLPHRMSMLDSIAVSWVSDSSQIIVQREAFGIRWSMPAKRDIRPFERAIVIGVGERFQPHKITDSRQQLRSFGAIERVDVEIGDIPTALPTSNRLLYTSFSMHPAPRRVMSINGALTSRQGAGGEVHWNLADLDFRRKAEELSLDLQAGLETVTPYLSNDSILALGQPWLNSRVLAANLAHSTKRLFPFGPQRFPKSNRPESKISIQFRDEKRPKFSRTYVQLGLLEQFVENARSGSRLELRPFEIALTASRLESRFVDELDALGSVLLASSFSSRALFMSGLSWWIQPPRQRGFQWRMHAEWEGAGNAFHKLDPRQPENTTIPLPSLFGSASEIGVARYTRWTLDLRAGWETPKRNGLYLRLFGGAALSSIPGSAVPLEKQFYVGGPNSLRGWRALGLGPGGEATGSGNVRGDIRLEANAEVRHYVNDWIQLAAFADAGNVWMARKEEGRPLAHFVGDRFLGQLGVSAGAGIRLDFGYFLLRFDAARPWIDPNQTESTPKRWRIHPAVSLPF